MAAHTVFLMYEGGVEEGYSKSYTAKLSASEGGAESEVA